MTGADALDVLFASIRPPLVVHRALIGRTSTPCGLPMVTSHDAGSQEARALPIASLHDRRVTCPGCAGVQP